MHEIDGLGRTFGNTGAAAFAFAHIYLGFALFIDDRHRIGTGPHAGETGGAFIAFHHGNNAADSHLILGKDRNRPCHSALLPG